MFIFIILFEFWPIEERLYKWLFIDICYLDDNESSILLDTVSLCHNSDLNSSFGEMMTQFRRVLSASQLSNHEVYIVTGTNDDGIRSEWPRFHWPINIWFLLVTFIASGLEVSFGSFLCGFTFRYMLWTPVCFGVVFF